jgi:hypothetical protein
MTQAGSLCYIALLRVERSLEVTQQSLGGRMYFVPEGQHDSSQARSAWNHEIKWPRPSGTIEQI